MLPPSEPIAPRRAKKVRPSFDVARADLGGLGARWVYRSDAQASAAVTAPAATEAKAPAPPVASPPVIACPAEDAPPEKSEPGWLALGVGVMTLPLTLTIMTMIAPVLWLAGSRPRR